VLTEELLRTFPLATTRAKVANSGSGKMVIAMGGGTFFKVGGHKCTSKNYRKVLSFELATVTSQALKHDIITYTPCEGLNYFFRKN